eukprot:Gregarina_sp_Pseudo_9__883@NODE_1563_length_1492_cov_30_838954_g1450_i0_p1_GENE_NODE_1563_length_1492_cov_30_838954_g1450_i0NODE_1563_length_1492_cov_30_838954_g1450_i0_p1_ORF_typecomplete_len393_score53_54IIGP/PF05049_13/2_4e49MMR_HSR1/PF01926_23/1_3e08RsgA_GTPase/PF03193_16/0_00026RsgA_GTPase/PF03193_16/6_4e02DUF87/PF01935_17/0_00011Dynamin_N/PF00350_23/3_2e03Dynamin_N/PF00350_23/0_012Dynamin_N/PF00350_23/89FeoB_N/PF02421_18/0_00046AIG1/PF04548_16/0_00072Golgin_A5/PF09787_9/0_0009DUF2730/PF108
MPPWEMDTRRDDLRRDGSRRDDTSQFDTRSVERAVSIGATLFSLYKTYESSNRANEAEDRLRKQGERFSALELQLEQTQRELTRQTAGARSVIADLKGRIRELTKKLERLVEPKCLPTPAEVELAKRRLNFQFGFFHIAVAGCSGTGKSSLINALRMLRNVDPAAAPVGFVETTAEIARYVSEDPKDKLVLYDIPGAGTLKVPRWEYFKSHLLYVFDAIILCSANRLYDTDFAILQHAANLKIRCFVIRSKCDQDLRSIRDNVKDSLRIENILPGDIRYKPEFETRYDDEVADFRARCQNKLDDYCETQDLSRHKLFFLSNRCLFSVLRESRARQVCVSAQDAESDLLDEGLFLQELAEWLKSESEMPSKNAGVEDRGRVTAESNETWVTDN